MGNGTIASSNVPSLRHVVLVDNSSGRIDATLLKVTANYHSLISLDRNQPMLPVVPIYNLHLEQRHRLKRLA